ncbi:hypothetical protein C1H76_2983 [Elsinoe australis]|uniref:Uncharacterized protein n=1 Tax=Elsinoe australis TaxID=40998 RepID=A0A4U7B0X3_9PEZI|nr:hypothetical protein C1H76_2983 [Elsinoe australis]
MSKHGDYMQFPASGEDVAALGQKLDNILAALQKLSTKDDHEETEERDTPPVCEPNPSKASSTATSVIYTPESSDIEIDGSSSPTQAVMHADSTIPNLDIETLAKILIGYHDLSNNVTTHTAGEDHTEVYEVVEMIKRVIEKRSHATTAISDNSNLRSDVGSDSEISVNLGHQREDQQKVSVGDGEGNDNLRKKNRELGAKCIDERQYLTEANNTLVAQYHMPSNDAEAQNVLEQALTYMVAKVAILTQEQYAIAERLREKEQIVKELRVAQAEMGTSLAAAHGKA